MLIYLFLDAWPTEKSIHGCSSAHRAVGLSGQGPKSAAVHKGNAGADTAEEQRGGCALYLQTLTLIFDFRSMEKRRSTGSSRPACCRSCIGKCRAMWRSMFEFGSRADSQCPAAVLGAERGEEVVRRRWRAAKKEEEEAKAKGTVAAREVHHHPHPLLLEGQCKCSSRFDLWSNEIKTNIWSNPFFHRPISIVNSSFFDKFISFYLFLCLPSMLRLLEQWFYINF